MLHTFPKWKYGLIIVATIIGIIYALPNLYGEDPAVQVTSVKNAKISTDTQQQIKADLDKAQVKYKSVTSDGDALLVRFFSTEVQIMAQDLIKSALGDNYSVALNLAPITPKWLACLGAKPMKLGLDLRGGVRFLIEVDVAASIARSFESDFADIRTGMRKEGLRYSQLQQRQDDADKDSGVKKISVIAFSFKDKADLERAQQFLRSHYPQHEIIVTSKGTEFGIDVRMSPQLITENKTYTIEQTMTTLRNRINELGVAEAIVQRQGMNLIVVELPGIQDTARARDILGKTATLDFVMVDSEADLDKALRGLVPPGRRLLYDRNSRPVVVKKNIILTGDSITGASSGFNSSDARPAVDVRLGGSGVGVFKRTTRENIGQAMAVIYREIKTVHKLIDGKRETEHVVSEELISVATIQSALGSQFQITGLSVDEARNLALLLRAGALPATISIVEERVIGPSMGQDNIQKGIISIVVGVGAVLLFMSVYYSVFGIIANLALLMNLVLLVAIMSLVGATLTLPGIAGIVLTLGMAVDANVLIFERIREELRMGLSPQASIQHGFKSAFDTIIDSNLTTLIVGIILFAIGTGPVRGFAVTLSIGILTSLFTAVTGTRAIVNFVYGNKKIKHLLIGI